MIERTVTIKTSLDARQAAFFVQTAGKYQSDIRIAIVDKKVNAKSIMGTIALGITAGQCANIIADGEDEEAAVNELASVLA